MTASAIYREHHYCRCGGALHLASDRQTVAAIAATWWAIHNGSRHGLASQTEARGPVLMADEVPEELRRLLAGTDRVPDADQLAVATLVKHWLGIPAHQPPYDGSPPCPACPVEIRSLHATAHNAIGAFEAAAKGQGDWSRAYRKMVELAEAVREFQPVVDGHFARPAHSHGDIRPMTDPRPDPPLLPPLDGTSTYLSDPIHGTVEQLAPIVDPVRAAALQAAVEWLPTRWAADGTLDLTQVLQAADRFAEWLAGGGQAEQVPVDPHPYILEQRPYPTADGQCLLITGPGRICGRRRDDPVHQGEAP